MDIAKILERFSELRVVVIGDVMLDHYITGDVSRISPEAPVPVVSITGNSYCLGGAANVAHNFAALGVPVTLVGAYSNDAEGGILQNILVQRRIALSSVGESENAATIIKTRVVAQGQQLCRIDRELDSSSYGISHCFNRQQIREVIGDADAVVFSDYAKGVVDDALIRAVREVAGEISNPPLLVVDPKPKRYLDLSGMTLMTPNRSEALQLAGFGSDPAQAFDDKAVMDSIFSKFGSERLVITLGSEGMLLGENGKVIGRLETEAREVFDVSGAGDTVVAVLSAALAIGEPLETSAKLANIAAGIVVSRHGTSPISSDELLEKIIEKS